jgi:hypothetical protein
MALIVVFAEKAEKIAPQDMLMPVIQTKEIDLLILPDSTQRLDPRVASLARLIVVPDSSTGLSDILLALNQYPRKTLDECRRLFLSQGWLAMWYPGNT